MRQGAERGLGRSSPEVRDVASVDLVSNRSQSPLRAAVIAWVVY